MWIGLFSFYFLRRSVAAAIVAFAAANYAVLLWVQGAGDGAERWGVTIGTVVVAGLAMDYMRGRLEAMVERLRDAVQRLSDAARTDPLTGLVNRRGFVELLDVELERAGRSGQPLSLVTADLDGFKAVNKRFGHPAGDDVLERTARVFERTRRKIDALARIGGEEFAVLLPDTREREAFVLAERLRGAIEREFADDPLPLTMSLGVASAPKDAHQADLLMGAADQSRHAAKRLGRNRTVIFSAEVVKVLDERPERETQTTEAQLAPLFKLAEALDLRDAGTAEHSQVVGQYCEMMARELGLEAPAVERIRLAGILHDVGKIGVSDAILRKPSPLTEEEWIEMRRHPEIGARLLGDDAPDIRGWILAHHERPDGKGYPYGLQGTAIPLEARILAVGDAFEAMTADRVYRSAMPRSEAMAELERHSGTQFDPWSSPPSSPRWTRAPASPLPPATPARRARYLASVRRGLVLVLCVVGLLAASAPAAGARSYAPRPGKAFHGGTGGYTERAIRSFARRSGRRPAVYQYFFTPGWRQPGRASMHWQRHLLLKTARQGARAILHLSTARGGHGQSVVTPRGLARGEGDAYLKALGSLIGRSRQVVYVRLMAEMNNFNNPYCGVTASGAPRGRHHSPRAYRKAWRRAALILRGGRVRSINRKLRRMHLPRVRTRLRALPRGRVSLMWNPFTAGLPNVAANSPGRYWPGGRYVDWVGTDLFANSPNFRGLNRFYRDRRWRRKPFMLGEWALWGREDPGFVRRLFAWIAHHPTDEDAGLQPGSPPPPPAGPALVPAQRARAAPPSAQPALRGLPARAAPPAPPPRRRPTSPLRRPTRRAPSQRGPSGGEPLPQKPLDPLLQLLLPGF